MTPFGGFESSNTTPVPDVLFDELLTKLSWDELKVMLYIIRRTEGFKKKSDAISLSQFADGITTKDGRVLDNGCGVKNRTRVSKILKKLEESGYIKIERPGIKTGLITYSIHYSTGDGSVPSTGDGSVPSTGDGSVPSTGDGSVPSTGDGSVHHKKQLTRNSKQETVRQESSLPTDATNVATPSQVSPSEEKEIPQPPQGKPEMPPDSMPWGVEKMVMLTELLRFCRGERGVYFSTQPIGKTKKSQRDRQLVAAKKILDEIPTLSQDEYVQAYSEQNNEWWNREKGSLTVEDMAANTPRKVMRVVELLEKVRTRSQNIKRSTTPTQDKPTQKDPPMNHDEACELAALAIKAGKEHGRDIQVQAISLENDAWGIVVRWNTQYFDRPETMRSQKKWQSALKAMHEVWQLEEKERNKHARNG